MQVKERIFAIDEKGLKYGFKVNFTVLLKPRDNSLNPIYLIACIISTQKREHYFTDENACSFETMEEAKERVAKLYSEYIPNAHYDYEWLHWTLISKVINHKGSSDNTPCYIKTANEWS